MRTVSHCVVIACATGVALGSGCSGGSLGPDAQVDRGTCAPYSGLTPSSCGGTVSAVGTTPVGAFSADVINAKWDQPCVSQQRLIEIDMGNTQSKDLVHINVLRASSDGAVGFIGVHAAQASLYSLRGCAPETTGTVTITEAVDPGMSSAQPGMVKGTFTLSNDGFSLSGSFEGPFCGDTLGIGCELALASGAVGSRHSARMPPEWPSSR